MISKKICLLGAVGVGKTSICRRFVHGVFSEKYHSTIGVKIDKRVVSLPEQEVNLIVWDLQGEDRYHKIMPTFMKGMSGYLLVVDVSSSESVQVGMQIYQRIMEQMGNVPCLLVLSKCDLPFDENFETLMEPLKAKAVAHVETSSLNDTGILEAFDIIADIVCRPPEQLNKAS